MAASSTHLARLRARPRSSLRAALLLYGLVFALAGTVAIHDRLPRELMLQESRLLTLAGQLPAYEQGAPPLLTRYGSGVESGNPRYSGTFKSAGWTDDPGTFVYLPLLGKVTGISDPLQLLGWFYAGLWGFGLLLFPLIFFELFGSVLAGLAAPVALLAASRRFDDTDIYFVGGWILIVGMPLVFVAWRRWRRELVLLLLGAAVLASFASAMRGHAGLPVALAALLVGLVKLRRGRERLVFALALTLAYLSIAPLAVNGLIAARDRAFANPALSEGTPTTHPLWHPAYLGLGWLDNPYGIRWNDAIAAAAVEAEDPDVGYLTTRYESILREKVLRIVRADPGFLARTLASKTVKLFGDAADRTGWAFVLLPFMLLLGRRRELPVYVGLLALAAPLAAAPLLLAIPSPTYEAGWLAIWGLILILGLLWLVAEAGVAAEALFGWARDARRPRLPEPDQLRRLGALTAIATMFALAASLALAPLAGRAHTLTENFVSLTLSNFFVRVPPNASQVRSWSFNGGYPPGWEHAAGTLEPVDGGSVLLATGDLGATQFVSPPTTLAAARYLVRVSGRVRVGGLEIQLVDELGEVLASATYWAGQHHSDGTGAMVAELSLTAPRDVRVLLVDWARGGEQRSRWLLRSVDILLVPSA